MKNKIEKFRQKVLNNERKKKMTGAKCRNNQYTAQIFDLNLGVFSSLKLAINTYNMMWFKLAKELYRRQRKLEKIANKSKEK